MKIVVNTRLLLKDKLEGIGWVAYECLRRIVKSHPEVEFYFIFDREPDQRFIFADNVKPVVLFPQARHPFLYIAFFEFAVARFLRKLKPDLYLSTDGYLSLRSKTKQLAVFHDLNFEHFPQDFPKIHLWHYKKFFPKYARKADRIITVSEFSKKDICDCYGINPDKIDVAYNGANEAFKPISEEIQNEIRQKYTDGNPYFMFVGSLHPRKNLARLFTAFDMFKSKNDNKVKLVIVGNKKWWTEPIKNAYDAMKHKDDVVFAGRLSAEDLHLVTASALASVYVSYFEGFGIPIVEAFKCDTPVITSNVTSMPEVAADAALLVDPFKIESIAEAMEKMLDEDVRKSLIEKGKVRREDFSWDKAAECWWKSIEKLKIESLKLKVENYVETYQLHQ
ncbi:MAG: glycosyltransferase family 4 protein [Bacteroidales bacterium]|nr:glycosyltransferase family 4 protein [Bacteroidales bacterium]